MSSLRSTKDLKDIVQGARAASKHKGIAGSHDYGPGDDGQPNLGN